MSGDSRIKDQPLIFYSDEMTVAKRILIQKHAEVVEYKGVRFQHRWRNGSCIQE